MCMKNIKKLLLLGLLIFSVRQANAQIMITEIMYDPSGTDTKREWIEIFNQSSSTIDVSKIKLRESGVGHKLIASDVAKPGIDSGEYAVIVDNVESFLEDNKNFSGVIFDSTFSLSNEGEMLEIINVENTVFDSVVYDTSKGGGGNGNSLQRGVVHDWFGSIPTPGSINAVAATEDVTGVNEQTPSTSNISSHTSSASLSTYKPTQQYSVYAGRNRMSVTNQEIVFTAVSKGLVAREKFTWNMGDGNSLHGKTVRHVFKKPGTYNVVLSGRTSEGYESISRSEVVIIRPNVSIEAFDYENGMVQLKNRGQSEVNIGYWSLRTGSDNCVFKRDTIISAATSAWIVCGYTFPDNEIANAELVSDDKKTIISQYNKILVPTIEKTN